MPKVLYLTTAAGPDDVIHEGSIRNVSKEVAQELIDGGFARMVSASEEATAGPSENASGRRGRSKAVSGPDEDA
jgi:hypothetical protein